MRRSARLRLLGAPARARWTGTFARAALLIAAVALLRWRAAARAAGEAPITVVEVRALLPGAATLEHDRSPRAGLRVLDAAGAAVGYALATMPAARGVTGYAGPTDTLVVLDEGDRIAGLRIRASADTPNHVDDVTRDRGFMGQLDGLTWAQAAAFDVRASAIDAVSGASLTSRAVMDGVALRLAGTAAPPARWHWSARDTVAIAVVAGALLLAFAGRAVRPRVRVAFAVATVAGLGLGGGDFVAQSLLVGWTAGAPPLRTAPGLVLLVVVAFVVPWASGRAIYCQQICPHGLLQDLVARLSPWRWRVRADVRRGLRWLPRGLLVLVFASALIGMPADYAALEPFDAYLLAGAAVFSIAWALVGLAAAVVVPRAYCRFGCPTGALLDGVRGR
jgi:hypothetical protein